MALKVLTAHNRKRKMPSQPVDVLTEEVKAFIKDLSDLMYKDDGAGLAAPQVGVLKQILVLDIKEDDGSGKGLMTFINPEDVEASSEKITLREGCLSLPGISAEITRPVSVTVRYRDEDFKEQTLHADKWLARCLLHEMDHLKGVLYIDHLSPLKRKMLLKRSMRYQRTREL